MNKNKKDINKKNCRFLYLAIFLMNKTNNKKKGVKTINNDTVRNWTGEKKCNIGPSPRDKRRIKIIE